MGKTRLYIIGIDGKMGQVLANEATASADFVVVGGLDKKRVDKVDIDIIIDFSRPECLNDVTRLALQKKCPVVLATTGYTKEQENKIAELSKKVPVFISGNMSFGIKVMGELVACATSNLANCSDIEIIEKHHNQKVDAPSGTALMLLDTVKNSTTKSFCSISGREGANCKRSENEIALHAIRGGTVVGEHEVSYYLNGEVITIKHTALSRSIFALGALKAARFLLKKPCGLYTMDNLIVGC